MRLKQKQPQKQIPYQQPQTPSSHLQIQTQSIIQHQTHHKKSKNNNKINQLNKNNKLTKKYKRKRSCCCTKQIFNVFIMLSIIICGTVIGQLTWDSVRNINKKLQNQVSQITDKYQIQNIENIRESPQKQVINQQKQPIIDKQQKQVNININIKPQQKQTQVYKKQSPQNKQIKQQQYKPIIKQMNDSKPIQIKINTTQIKNQQNINIDTNTKQNKQNNYIYNYSLSLSQSPQIYNIWKISKIRQLPFCILIVAKQINLIKQIILSIHKQNYQNYVIINTNFDIKQNENINMYSKYKQLIKQKCAINTVIVILNKVLQLNNILQKFNQMHQKYNTWVLYSNQNINGLYQNGKKINRIQVLSFYYRIYDLLNNNDFQGNNLKYLEQGNYQIMALGILELCSIFSKNVSSLNLNENIDKNQKNYIDISPLWVNQSGSILFNRTAYQKMYKLSQDYKVNLQLQQQRYDNIKRLKSQPFNTMTPQKMAKAIQRQQLMYLPLNHTISQIEYIQYTGLYRFLQNQQSSNETKFCVTVLSHNNIPQNRYKKSLLSIFQQQYTNYRVVFIDDNSNDNNSQQSIRYAKQLWLGSSNNDGKNRSKFVFVQNNRRMYATYNIINAAFNYCYQDQIQLLLDGDDQLIGRYAFKIMDANYRKSYFTKGQQKWIIYSNFKSNLYTYGTSQFIRSINQLILNGKRKSNHFIGPIRTWRVQLLYNIPLGYHQNSTGDWFDTVYDDAMQHSIVQLSGIKRIQHISEILYEYNKQYGDNDDATLQKKKHRRQIYDWVLNLQPLRQLKDIQGSIKNKQVVNALEKDRGIGYFVKQQW